MKYTNESTGKYSTPGVIYAVIKAGLLAGTLDILIAMIHYYLKTGKNAVVVLKFIASALYGKEAFARGDFMAGRGLVLHFIIAFGWTIFFFLLHPRVAWLAKNKIITGILYGVFIWLIMNLAVLPMTSVPKSPFNIVPALTGAIILVVAVGLPISVIANKYYSTQVEN